MPVAKWDSTLRRIPRTLFVAADASRTMREFPIDAGSGKPGMTPAISDTGQAPHAVTRSHRTGYSNRDREHTLRVDYE